MKYMIISDIHGDIYALNKVFNIYFEEKCNKLIILGDLFNYGIDLNRNDIIDKLNLFKDNIICVRGNCDYNINDILFDISYSKELTINKKNVFLTHGNLYNKEYLLGSNYDIILSGHTHIADIIEEHNKLFLNPGSISIPRKGEKSFLIIEDEQIYLKNLDNKIILHKKYSFK